MKNFVKKIDAVNRWIGEFVSWWILIVLAVVIYEVIMRYAFKMPTTWGFELTCYLFGAMWILGGALALEQKTMVTMEVLYVRLPIRTRAILDVCTFILCFGFVAIVFWKSAIIGWDSLMILERSGSAWNPPFWPLRIALPIGSFLLLWQILSKLIKDLYIITRGDF